MKGWEVPSKLDGHESGIGMEAMMTWCIKLDHKVRAGRSWRLKNLRGKRRVNRARVGHISQGIRYLVPANDGKARKTTPELDG